MTSGLPRAVAAVVAAVSLGLVAARPGAAQPAATAPEACPDPVRPKDGDAVSFSVFGCRECHGRTPDNVADSKFSKTFQSNTFVRLTEANTWDQEDPHSAAFAVLDGPLGRQMDDLLKKHNPAFKDGVKNAPQCLTCHAIDMKPWVGLREKKAADFKTKEGITCNACHGLKTGWQDPHWKDTDGEYVAWRGKTPEEKQTQGLRNLRDPAVRAKFCASCHVGSACEGKVVTHEMYAAGHPPLPPFELGTFMDCQPRHWGYPTDPAMKYFTPAGAAAFEKASGKKLPENWSWSLYRFHPADQEVYNARSVAAGAIAALRAEMKMLAADAVAAADPTSEGIDYARFDCYACHHNLEVPSDRQKRGYEGGRPGRPPMKAWLAALPGVVAEHATGLAPLADLGKQFPARWAAVRTAALARPFGEPAGVKAAATDLAAWCDAFLDKSAADGKPLYTKAEAEKLLAAVAAAATSEKWTADPEAAMHLTWAYLSLRGEVGGRPDPAALAALGQTVPVRVRSQPYSDEKKLPVPASAAIGPRLTLFGGFKAPTFTARFRELQKK